MVYFKVWRSALAAIIMCGAARGGIAAELASVEGQLSLIVDIDVPAEVVGRVAAVEVKEGEVIRQDQILVQLTDLRAKEDVVRAQSELEISHIERANDVERRYAQKNLDVQLQELARSTAANQMYDNSVSLTEVRRLELLVEQSRLSIEKAEQDQAAAAAHEGLKAAELRLAELNLGLHTISSPSNGMVVTVYRQPGEWVNAGDPVVRVVQLDHLRVEAFVAAEVPSELLLGRTATFVVARRRGLTVGESDAVNISADTDYAGKVVFVSPELNPVTGQYRIWAEIDNRDGRLRPGMRGTLSVDDGQ